MSEEIVKEEIVKGINKADFQSWRHNPVSKVFLRYLADKRSFLEQSILDQWMSGSLTLMSEQTVRGQIIELFEIEALPFEALSSFYEESNGTETNQDPAR